MTIQNSFDVLIQVNHFTCISSEFFFPWLPVSYSCNSDILVMTSRPSQITFTNLHSDILHAGHLNKSLISVSVWLKLGLFNSILFHLKFKVESLKFIFSVNLLLYSTCWTCSGLILAPWILCNIIYETWWIQTSSLCDKICLHCVLSVKS